MTMNCASHPNADAVRVLAAAKRHFLSLHLTRDARHADAEAERAFMETGEPVPVSYAGEHLEVRRWGSGPRVLLVHGLFRSGGTFRLLIPTLVEAGLQPIAFDAPGHGASPGALVDTDLIADAMLMLREALGAFSGIVAHSMGVVWTLRALGAGLGMDRGVCIGAPVRLDTIDFYVSRSGLEPEVEAHLRRLVAPFSVGMESLIETARRLEQPSLIVHDRDDPLAPFEGGEELARAWMRSRALWTSRLGHFKTLRSPAVLSAIASFLSDDAGGQL
jgi:pimeloyl-ACP methyl ester carboxylesterase